MGIRVWSEGNSKYSPKNDSFCLLMLWLDL
jgi:hypothetical protein